ncbi:MAG TPA: hypothetical protein VFN19_00675, partial [Candidatus Nanopelagicales bacterium]|nr:hypothetical protein [Candidatus Nanopelagicales bacterium]
DAAAAGAPSADPPSGADPGSHNDVGTGSANDNDNHNDTASDSGARPAGRSRRAAWITTAVVAALLVAGAIGDGATRPSTAAASPPPTAPAASAAPTPLDDNGSVGADPLSAAGLPPGEDTLVLGDSLALGVYPWLADDLPDRYVSYVAEVGSGTDWSVQALEQMVADDTPIPQVVVVSAGTNDFSAEQFRTDAGKVLELLGPDRCVAWADVVRPEVVNGMAVDPAEDLNKVLHELADSHPNLTLLDWTGLVAKNPSWLVGDGVHPPDEGLAARAELFATASQQCSATDPNAPRADRQVLPNSVFYDGSTGTDTSSPAAYSGAGSSGSSGSGGDDSYAAPTTPRADPTPTRSSKPRPRSHPSAPAPDPEGPSPTSASTSPPKPDQPAAPTASAPAAPAPSAG